MSEMLSNLAVFLASAGIAAGVAYGAWRIVTHGASQQHPPR